MRLKVLTLGLFTLLLTANISNAAFPVNATNPVAIELSSTAPAQNQAAEARVLKSVKAPIIRSSQPSRSSGGGSGVFGIVSLVTGIVALLMPTAAAVIAFAAIAVVFGALGLNPSRSLKGLAIAGLILGIICLAIGAIYLATF